MSRTNYSSNLSDEQTELAAEFPIHVACTRIGNSPAIANRHDLTVTESDFERAANARHCAHQNMPESSKISLNTDEQIEENSRRKRGESSVSLRNEGKENGRYRTRTCDLFRVKEAR